MTVRDLLEMKRRGDPIAVLTCYDVLFARLLEEAGVDIILVGDSLGQVVLGYDSTLPVTLDEMIHHTKAVRRGAPHTFTVMDLPFLSYQVSDEDALRSAGRALKETGVQAVKLEGGDEKACSRVRALVQAGIPVMGHVGFVPQSIHALSGNRVQGRGGDAAARIRAEAKALQAAGCFSVVLELVSGTLAAEVTRELAIPTIGIGAGVECDGQVLVLPDALGLNPAFSPRFLRRYAELARDASLGIAGYVSDVKARRYPGPEHTFAEEA
ncbi:MAG: 3-methyl-2-oxobutanoate hydroxymethyltransferase [Gemmatimonadetes bacterium]|nr:3-methyl-2-oxobutanoate hydroxymethyltransferase [Gemmatimonadota bacterium]